MAPPKAHQPLRLAVAMLLQRRTGSLYSVEDIATLLGMASDVEGNEEIRMEKVDASLLVRAFQNGAAEEYELSYRDCFGRRDDNHILYVRKETRSNNKRMHSIGRFRSIAEGRSARVVRPSVGLGGDYTHQLVQYLIKESQPKPDKKRKQKERSPKKEQQHRKQPRPGTAGTGQPAASSNSNAEGAAGETVTPPPAAGPPAPDADGAGQKEELGPEEYEGPIQVYYNLRGRAGKIEMKSDGSVSFGDLVAGLGPLDYRDNAKARKNRHAKKYYRDFVGAISFWVPSGVVAVTKNQLARVRKESEWGRNFKGLFQGKQCAFSFEFQRTIGQYGLHAMRGSREGKEMLIAAVLKGLAEEIGMPLSNRQLAYGCPSQHTLARGELTLGGMSLVHVVRMIKKDGAKWLALMVDHGKRSGIEHFVKLLIWAGFDEEGKPVIKYQVLDVNKSGHAGEDCASAIKNSVDTLKLAGLDTTEVQFVAITGDAGGGGAVQNIFPLLQKNKVLDDLAKMMNCQFHALNKCFETACQNTFGKQGIHRINIFQAAYIYVQLIKQLREMGGHELIDTIQGIVVEKIMSCEKWQCEAMKTNAVACDSFFRSFVNNPDCSSDELIDALADLLSEGHRNVRSPNMSRWFTIIPAVTALVDNWTVIYFICVAVVQRTGASSALQLNQYASSLLQNMNTASGKAGTENTTEEHVPPVYVQGLFVKAFGEAYFNESFGWLLRSDPEFGPDSWGQTIRLYIEHTYWMALRLKELQDEDDGWLHNPAFSGYVEALDHLPTEGEKSEANRQYFEEAPKSFFKGYDGMFVKHVSTIVRSDEILVYLVGTSTPTLVRMFLKYLFHMKDNGGGEENATNYAFESKLVRMQHHGASNDEAQVIDTQKCLDWLTSDVLDDEGNVVQKHNPLAIVEDPVIKDHEGLWRTMASAADEVNLWDRSTWHGVDYRPLVRVVHEKISIHPNQQQRVESLVQMCGFISSSNVSEAVRTQRALALSGLMRPYNAKAKKDEEARRKKVNAENAKLPKPKKPLKEEVKRVEGGLRTRTFGNYIDKWNKEVDEELLLLGEEKFKALLDRLRGDGGNSESSKRDLEKLKKKFISGLSKRRNVTKQQQNLNGIDLTAEMDGAVKMVKLTKKYDKEMLAEVKARGIELAMDWEDMSLQEKRDALRQDELKHWIVAGKCRDGAQISDVKQLIPQSEALIALKSKLNS